MKFVSVAILGFPSLLCAFTYTFDSSIDLGFAPSVLHPDDMQVYLIADPDGNFDYPGEPNFDPYAGDWLTLSLWNSADHIVGETLQLELEGERDWGQISALLSDDVDDTFFSIIAVSSVEGEGMVEFSRAESILLGDDLNQPVSDIFFSLTVLDSSFGFPEYPWGETGDVERLYVERFGFEMTTVPESAHYSLIFASWMSCLAFAARNRCRR